MKVEVNLMLLSRLRVEVLNPIIDAAFPLNSYPTKMISVPLNGEIPFYIYQTVMGVFFFIFIFAFCILSEEHFTLMTVDLYYFFCAFALIATFHGLLAVYLHELRRGEVVL